MSYLSYTIKPGFKSVSVTLNQNSTSVNETNNTSYMTSNTSESSNLTTTTEVVTTTNGRPEEKHVIDYSEDYPAKEVEKCYFVEDILNASIEILSKRCQRAISGKVIPLYFKMNSIYLHKYIAAFYPIL